MDNSPILATDMFRYGQIYNSPKGNNQKVQNTLKTVFRKRQVKETEGKSMCTSKILE